MKKLEFYLNVLHYWYYKVHFNLYLWSNKIDPTLLILKIPFIKRKYEKLGVNVENVANDLFGNKRYGFSIQGAGGILIIMLSLLLMAVINLFYSVLNNGDNTFITSLVTCTLLSGAIWYFFIAINGKDLRYFKKFEKWTTAERKKYSRACFVFNVVIIIVIITSMNWPGYLSIL